MFFQLGQQSFLTSPTQIAFQKRQPPSAYLGQGLNLQGIRYFEVHLEHEVVDFEKPAQAHFRAYV
ncbi:hypothetical protein AAFN60_09525 [Roseibacillus persicicus]|uniref:hypothetical protein n=1 Tax=Roseibacillus persicicus TaxID=454148 RepID=UPI00398B3437